jgi:LL-diaminopimelate aminotransferase
LKIFNIKGCFMTKINENFLKLSKNYLFAEIANRTRKFKEENPSSDIIKLGIGDVTRPLPKSIIKAMKDACDDMGVTETFQGYGPYEGFEFLRQAISDDYSLRNVKIGIDEIFVSDGAKGDAANISEIFSPDSIIAVCDPVYPVYVDSNVLAGKMGIYDNNNGRWSRAVYLSCCSENNFLPELPKEKVDLIYLCFPNNPTGMAIGKDELQKWVDYAVRNNCFIIYDGAYESFITEDFPHSIYECNGAKKCAIELRSFSKDAGFTGVRCGYSVIPNDLKADGTQLNAMWLRRQATKYNGTSYITQRGAAARFSSEGKKEINEILSYYKNNAKIIYNGLKEAGFEVYGAINSPYIWLKTPNNMKSWDFFDLLLTRANVVGTPGSGFGIQGEGYFRLTSFGSTKDAVEAIERIKTRI